MEGASYASKQELKKQDAWNESEEKMKAMKPMKSMPIVGGVQMGHYVTPKNHASAGVIADMPMATNMSKVMGRRMSAKRPAMKQLQGK